MKNNSHMITVTSEDPVSVKKRPKKKEITHGNNGNDIARKTYNFMIFGFFFPVNPFLYQLPCHYINSRGRKITKTRSLN